MKQGIKELQKLKAVGEILSRRLVAAGYDTFAKIAAAGEEGLKNVQGVNPRLFRSILTQAGELANEVEKGHAKMAAELKQRSSALKEQVLGIAHSVRDRFQEQAAGKAGKKTEKEILKVIASLEKVEEKMGTRVKKAGKGLVKAEKRLEGLADAGLKEVGKGLKKARRSLRKMFAK